MIILKETHKQTQSTDSWVDKHCSISTQPSMIISSERERKKKLAFYRIFFSDHFLHSLADFPADQILIVFQVVVGQNLTLVCARQNSIKWR